MTDQVPTERPATPELVPLWQELMVRYEERVKDLKERQAKLEETMMAVENMLAVPLGCCLPGELSEARVNMRWAVHWRDNAIAEIRLVAWRMRMLSATDYFMEVYDSY